MIHFNTELFADFLAEAGHLLAAHYEEIAWRKDKIPLDPDYAQYQRLEDARRLVTITARNDENELIGYALWFVAPHLHYKGTMVASNDIIYIAPAYRGGVGVLFLRFCTDALKGFDVKVLTLHIKNCLDWSPLAQREGFDPVESTHMKWIGD